MIEIVRLDDSKRPAFEALLADVWQQTWPDTLAKQIVRWRYYDRPHQADTWLAMDQGCCVGLLDSMLRPYLLDGQRHLVRETADWYCAESHRSAGVGMKLLWRMRLHPESVFVVGGSPASRNVLEKMRWEQFGPSGDFVLPIKARSVAAILLRTLCWPRERLACVLPSSLPAKRLRRIKPPAGRRPSVRVLHRHDPLGALPPIDGSHLIQLFERHHWDWLSKMPDELARPIGLEFFLDGIQVGFSLAQIEPAATGVDGKILHFQVTDASLAGWVVAETTQLLADHHVGFIRTRVSTASKTVAMQQVGYIKVHDLPCYWLPRASPAPSTLDVGFLRGDDAVPYRVLRGRKLARITG